VPSYRIHRESGSSDRFVAAYLGGVGVLAEEASRGIPVERVVKLSSDMHRSNEYVYRILRFPSATAKRKLKKEEPMSPDQSERVLGLERLIGLVEVMIKASGTQDESFNAPVWVANWLDRPCPALGNKRPAEYMSTRMGQELVEGILAQMQSGAYA
jgi:putative toxin-antitoxin system antitoxin component (TIGR02293 family)